MRLQLEFRLSAGASRRRVPSSTTSLRRRCCSVPATSIGMHRAHVAILLRRRSVQRGPVYLANEVLSLPMRVRGRHRLLVLRPDRCGTRAGAPVKLFLCTGCNRHVRECSVACPFCGAVVSTTPCLDDSLARRMSRGAMVAGARRCCSRVAAARTAGRFVRRASAYPHLAESRASRRRAPGRSPVTRTCNLAGFHRSRRTAPFQSFLATAPIMRFR